MGTRDRIPVVAWAVLGVLVGTSALAVVAARASGALALGVTVAGIVTALLLAWAAQPAAGSGGRAEPAAPAESGEHERHEPGRAA